MVGNYISDYDDKLRHRVSKETKRVTKHRHILRLTGTLFHFNIETVFKIYKTVIFIIKFRLTLHVNNESMYNYKKVYPISYHLLCNHPYFKHFKPIPPFQIFVKCYLKWYFILDQYRINITYISVFFFFSSSYAIDSCTNILYELYKNNKYDIIVIFTISMYSSLLHLKRKSENLVV